MTEAYFGGFVLDPLGSLPSSSRFHYPFFCYLIGLLVLIMIIIINCIWFIFLLAAWLMAILPNLLKRRRWCIRDIGKDSWGGGGVVGGACGMLLPPPPHEDDDRRLTIVLSRPHSLLTLRRRDVVVARYATCSQWDWLRNRDRSDVLSFPLFFFLFLLLLLPSPTPCTLTSWVLSPRVLFVLLWVCILCINISCDRHWILWWRICRLLPLFFSIATWKYIFYELTCFDIVLCRDFYVFSWFFWRKSPSSSSCPTSPS